jgi:plastocyanin
VSGRGPRRRGGRDRGGTLSSEDPPRPQSLPARVQQIGTRRAGAVAAALVGERGRRFTPQAVTIRTREALTIVNDDTRTHTIRIDDPRMTFSSEAQEPGDKVVLVFDRPGAFTAICGIHPDMRLDIVALDGAERGDGSGAGASQPNASCAGFASTATCLSRR